MTPCLLRSFYLLTGTCWHRKREVTAQLVALPPSPVVTLRDSTLCDEGTAQPPNVVHLHQRPRDSSRGGRPDSALTLLTAAEMSFPLVPGSHGDSGCEGMGTGLSYCPSLLLSANQVKPLPLDFSSQSRGKLLLAFVEIRFQGWG